MQFRLTRSINTGQYYSKAARELLGTQNPQSLGLRCLLAENLLANGNYASAGKELKELLAESQRLYTSTHPETLRYQSTFALSMYHGGKLDQAYRLAIEVLKRQNVELLAYNAKVRPISKTGYFPQVGRLEDNSELDQTRLDEVVQALGEGPEDGIIHPSLVMALVVLALVGKQKGTERGLANALKIFHVLPTSTKSQLRCIPLLVLSYETDLAWIGHSEGHDRLLEVIKELEQIHYSQWRTWRTMNACTASARRELLISQCALAEWDDSELHPGHVSGGGAKSYSESNRVDYLESLSLREKSQVVVQGLSQEILTTHEHQLGRCHLETIKSLSWLFTMKALLRVEKDELPGLLDDGLGRLREQSTRSERLAESLQMEHKFVTMIIHLGLAARKPDFAQKALEILHHIHDTIAQLPSADDGLNLAREDLVDLERLVDFDIEKVQEIARST